MEQDLYMLFSGAPIAHGHSMGFYVYGVRAGDGGREKAAATLENLRGFVQRLIAEDGPVLDTIRFRPRTLVASDRHLARFLKFVREFRARCCRWTSERAEESVVRGGRRLPRPPLQGGAAPLRHAGAPRREHAPARHRARL
jgi:hypothetical protein